MKTTKNTVLITGGSAGIGLEIARLLTANENKVIITGRSRERLDAALKVLPGAVAIQNDVSEEGDIQELAARLGKEYPDINVLINNAGAAFLHDIGKEETYVNTVKEMQTNYLSVIRLTEKVLPLLRVHPVAAIVNVTSIVALIPSASLPTYAASKAALHFYTQSLRNSLAGRSSIQVYELMPPLVNTRFSAAIGGASGISPEEVAKALFEALENDQLDIPVGQTQPVYEAFHRRLQALSLCRRQIKRRKKLLLKNAIVTSGI